MTRSGGARVGWIGALLAAVQGSLAGCAGETTVPPPSPRAAPTSWIDIGHVAPKNDTFALSAAAVPGFPDYRAASNPVIRLDLAPGRLGLPRVLLPGGLAELSADFVVPHKELPNAKNAPRKLKVLVAPLPFAVESEDKSFAPAGMSVSVEGKPVPFGRGPANKADGPTWRIAPNGRQVVLSYPTVPGEGAVKVHWPHVHDLLERHDPGQYVGDKHTAEEYFHTSVSVGGDTWNGLSFVAPTVAEWEVALPAERPRFRGAVGLEAAPVEEPASDGAALVLTVVADGAETEVDRRQVSEAGPPEAWEVDLSRWAGRTVTVRLWSDPGPDPTFDWLYVAGPVIDGAPAHEPRRVVVVAMDTTRPDHLSFFGYERPTPELDQVLGRSVVLDHAWSTAPRTRPSFRSSTTGHLPLQAVGARNIGDEFRRHGFVTAGIVANVHLQPRFDFDDGFDSWSFDGKANAKQQVDRGLAWLRANAEDDAYLFLHFMDPHMAYDAPAAWRNRYVPDPQLPDKVQRADVMQWIASGRLTDAQKQELEGLHDGEMAYLSNQLGRLFQELDKLPGRTLVVIHSDHGEEFWEHGGFEHNHSLYDELVRTILAFRPGGGVEGRRLSGDATLMDIAPTLYDAFGFADAPPVDGRSLLPALGGADAPERALPVGYLQYAHERWAVVWRDQKYILHTGSGEEELYDLAADPEEKRNLAAGADLAPWRQRLKEVHQELDVGPGWRVSVRAKPGDAALVLSLPAEARGADVLDPESIVEHRANIEWNETPKKTAPQVGKVTLSEDRRTVTWIPGSKPQGVLWVRFDAPTPAAKATATRGGAAVPIGAARGGRCDEAICVTPGTVVVPPPPEFVRMQQQKGDAEDIAMLCALGYMTEGCPEDTVAPEPRSDDEGDGDGDGG